MTASLLDIATEIKPLPKGPRKINVGAGYKIQLNPVGPAFTNKDGIEVQKFAINLWLSDSGNIMWHLVCLGGFTIPPRWSNTQILKLAVQWLIIPAAAWDKKNTRLTFLHREWLDDQKMVDEFKITTAYTIMGRGTKSAPEFRFRRDRRISEGASVSSASEGAVAVGAPTGAPTAPESTRAHTAAIGAQTIPISASVQPANPAVSRLQAEADNHGNLLQALSGLQAVNDG